MKTSPRKCGSFAGIDRPALMIRSELRSYAHSAARKRRQIEQRSTKMTKLTAIRLHILSTYRNEQRPISLAKGTK